MKYDVLRDAEKYTRVHKRKRLRHRVVTILAGVVVFCTTYALILPAITLEKQCDIPEHTHTDACYAQVTSVEKRVPACSAKTLEIHQHTADCCDANGNPTCGYADFVVHSHDSRCYDEKGSLWCLLPEIEAHRHTADCYALPEGHTHAEGCYTSVRGDLVCGEHVHTDACYTETPVLACGREESEEHRHDESCYETSREPTCGIDSDHSHTDACYEWEQVLSCDLPTDSAEDAQPVLVCTKPEIILHRHTSDCFDADGNLICGQTQVLEHQHSDACFETVAESVDTGTLTCTDTAHVHTARCYGTWKLVCGQEEHTHSEACTQNEQEEPVFCGKDAHTHGEACRDENGQLVCGTEEHTHSLACYADPGADVETAELWEQTFAGVTLTGNWRQDTLAIAETQLGYTESTKNYVVAEDGKTVKGYTRYGAWCGEPYGDWNVMFLTFCLHYAGVEGVDRDCGGWVTSWADAFEPAQSHTPAVGDLVLFDRDGDGTADRAGLVAQITDSGFAAMEGDAEDAVRLLTYGADDPGILGYINLPEGPKEFTLTAQTENGITVTITGESASLPYPAREITVTVTEVTDGERRTIRDQILGEEQAEPERSYLLDITLWHGEDEIEPTGSVTVTFSGIDTEGLYPKVYHIDTNAQTATDMEAKTGENGDVTIDTNHFSWYLVQAQSFQPLSGYVGDAFINGGEFQLTGDAYTADGANSPILSITKNTTIDLNGHTLTISKANQYFDVHEGAKLTIMDSSDSIQDTESTVTGNVYGNKATLENDTLTYYITKSTANGTGTTETLVKHTVPLAGAGKILCQAASAQAILVKGALELQSGVLQNTGGQHIFTVDRGTLDINGGYIVGSGSNGTPGGGIYVDNGTVNLRGGVIAANRGSSGGGIFFQNGTLNISGGAVTGNEVINGHTDNGGGIYVNSGTLNLSGEGYVTNNYKACDCNECQNDVNNTHGGGGIALANSSVMNMTGGYVTGNYSGLAGGGIYAGFHSHNVKFTMSGGTIASNCAELGEGGGLRIAGGTDGVIQATNKVYITNNITNSNNDWGGGGIFVQDKGNLNITNALITDNTAGGYGGGVAACPTGETLITHTEGAAIYENIDYGKKMSGGGNDKTADKEVAQKNDTFTSNGHKDYFCVRSGGNNPISLVTGRMLGDGAANWTGSSDGKHITISKTGYATANYLFGLAAEPDSEAIAAAKNAARVIITGNQSSIHGGGIMTNGGLILGRKEEIVTATPELDIIGTKALLKDGVKQNEGLNFQFKLTDSEGKEVGTATSDAATGQFTISPDVQYSQTGTHTYTLSEVNDNRAGITYDTNIHKIQVTIAEKTVSLLGVTFKSYYVSSVTLDGSESGGSSGSGSGTGSQTGTFRVRYQNTNNWNNVNVYVWDDAKNKIVGDWPGEPMKKDTDGTYYYDLTVTGTGNYNYVFNNGSGEQTGDIPNVPYAPGEEAVFKFSGVVSNTAASGSSGAGDAVGQGANPDGSYTLTIPDYAFTNTMTTQLNLQITKTDSVNASTLLPGATFTLTKAGTENPMEATTKQDGIATFTGIQRGVTYYLRETVAPSNYMVAGPWILEVGEDGSATLYPATEKADKTLEKASDTGTPLTVSGTDPKVLSVTIRDISWGYELPDTGGAGTTSYTAGGLALIFGAATLLYSHCRRRKEDEASS